jgi:glycosyltransferase involved in cell wall biosynthesis
MMKKVLIICDSFPPLFAPRIGYLCKYIIDYEWESFVLSAEMTCVKHHKDFSFLAQQTEVIRIYVSDDEKQKHSEAQKNIFTKKIKSFFLPDYNHRPCVNEKMFLEGVKILQKNRFDIILCSTSEITPLGVAKRLSKIFNIPWIADLRDIEEQVGKDDHMSFRDWMYFQKKRLRRNYLLHQAAAVISVSPWHVDLLKKINFKSHLIYNGFDPALFKFEQPRVTERFIMCYAGVIIDKLHDLSFLFAALSLLIADKIINPDRFQLCFYSDSKSHEYVMTQAKHYNIEFLIDCKNYVNATIIPEILHQSNVLLLLSNKSTPDGPNGIMTTKFFEYLGTGRPILLTRSDEAHLEQALVEANAGIAAHTVNEVYDFIKNKYLEWQVYGYTKGTTDRRVISKYSRKNQAKQFVSIFNEIIQK